MQILKIVSLFAGCGGTDIGFHGGFTYLNDRYKKHPVKMVFANDFDAGACDIFDENFQIEINRDDVRQINSDLIPEHDILTAGFPCQSYSIVAQNPIRLGIKDSDKGMLFQEVCRVLNDKKPLCFVCENVKGILSSNGGRAFPLIIQAFRSCGYYITHVLLNAFHYGVPQNRERVFIIGFREQKYLDAFCPPMPVNKQRFLREVVYDESCIDDRYYFSNKAIDGMLKANKAMNKGRAQNLDAPCNTVGAHLAKVSLNSTDPVLCINNRYRRFVPREVARIQSFPDEFKLVGTDSKQYRALGNAIPPVLAWHVAHSVISAINHVRK